MKHLATLAFGLLAAALPAWTQPAHPAPNTMAGAPGWTQSAPAAPQVAPGTAAFPDNGTTAQALPATAAAPLNGSVAILRDQLPWGMTAIDDLLTARSIPFEVHSSAELATLDFSRFRLLIIPSVQTEGFYAAYRASLPKFVTFLNGGGNLLFSFCDWLLAGPTPHQIPGAAATIVHAENPSNTLNPDYLTHPVLVGVPSPFLGNFASHNYFTAWPASARVLAVATGTNFPTLIEYKVGAGTVLATGITLEWLYTRAWPAGPLLPQAIDYLYTMPIYDRYFRDDAGRTQVWLNSTTGAWRMQIMAGAYAGSYTGTAAIAWAGSVLTLPPPPAGQPKPWLYGFYNAAQMKASFTLRTDAGVGYQIGGLCLDTNTTGAMPN